jgi:hypothetical protein
MLEGFRDFGHLAVRSCVVGIGLEAVGEDGLGAFEMSFVDERCGGWLGGMSGERDA